MVKNTTDYPTSFLAKMMGWCAREMDLPSHLPMGAEFTKCSQPWRGRAWSWSMRILVRIGEAKWFPYHSKGYKGGPRRRVLDRIEALVHVISHELFHLKQYHVEEYTGRGREADCEHIALSILNTFRRKRNCLLTLWFQEPKRQAASKS